MQAVVFPVNEQWGSKFCRSFVILISLLTIIFVLPPVGMLIKAYVHLDNTWNNMGNLGLVAFIMLQLAVILIVLTAVGGIVAARKRNSKLMSYYVFFMFFWFIILFTVGLVSSIVTPLYFSTKSDQACRRIPAFERLQYYAEEAQRTICFTCNCYFPNSDNFKQYTTAELQKIQSVEAPLLSRTNNSYPIRVQDCQGWNGTQLSKGFDAMEQLEKQLQCAGWCDSTSSLFYRFTDVNGGKPSNTCYKRLSEMVLHYTKIISVLTFIQSILCLICFIGGISFMSGTRVFRSVNDGHQLSTINGASFQQSPAPFAKNILQSHVMPVDRALATSVIRDPNAPRPENSNSFWSFLRPIFRSNVQTNKAGAYQTRA